MNGFPCLVKSWHQGEYDFSEHEWLKTGMRRRLEGPFCVRLTAHLSSAHIYIYFDEIMPAPAEGL